MDIDNSNGALPNITGNNDMSFKKENWHRHKNLTAKHKNRKMLVKELIVKLHAALPTKSTRRELLAFAEDQVTFSNIIELKRLAVVDFTRNNEIAYIPSSVRLKFNLTVSKRVQGNPHVMT